jgi:hypothetical protein
MRRGRRYRDSTANSTKNPPHCCQGSSGSVASFLNPLPNKTFCSDNELARIGFMSVVDCKSYVESLESAGLILQREGRCVDIVVADQIRGFTMPCDGADFGKVEIENTPKPGCQLRLPGERKYKLHECHDYTAVL